MYNPEKRSSADDCLLSSYFREHPLPSDPSMMSTFPEYRNRKSAGVKEERKDPSNISMQMSSSGNVPKISATRRESIEHLVGTSSSSGSKSAKKPRIFWWHVELWFPTGHIEIKFPTIVLFFMVLKFVFEIHDQFYHFVFFASYLQLFIAVLL